MPRIKGRVEDLSRASGPERIDNRWNIVRPRLNRLLQSVTAYPIATMVAPAGFGKSTAVRHFMKSRDNVAFVSTPPSSTLQQFVAALAQGCLPLHTEMSALPDDASTKEGSEGYISDVYLSWALTHLCESKCTIVVDDLHLAEHSATLMAFIIRLVDGSKHVVNWILVSRARGRLPLARWQAYGDADAPVSADDLRMDILEAADLSNAVKSPANSEDLKRWILQTNGYIVPMAYAIRTSAQRNTCENIMDGTRKVTFEFIAEQVWSRLTSAECKLLEVASFLPDFQTDDFESCGIENASEKVANLCATIAFLSIANDNIFSIHSLFRDFIHRHLNSQGGSTAKERRGAAIDILIKRALYEDAIRMLVETADFGRITAIVEMPNFAISDTSLIQDVVNGTQNSPTSQLGLQMLLLHVDHWGWLGNSNRARKLAEEIVRRNDGTSKQLLRAARAIFRSINVLSDKERAPWLSQLTEVINRLEPEDRIVAQAYTASFLSRDASTTGVASDMISDITRSEDILNTSALVDVHMLISTAYFYMNDHEAAIRSAGGAVEYATSLHERRERARALNNLGILLFNDYNAEVSTIFEPLRTLVERSGCWAFSHVSHWVPAIYFALSGHEAKAAESRHLQSSIHYTDGSQRSRLRSFQRRSANLGNLLTENYHEVILDDRRGEVPSEIDLAYALATDAAIAYALVKDFSGSENALKLAAQLRGKLSERDLRYAVEGVIVETIAIGANGHWFRARKLYQQHSGRNAALSLIEIAIERFCDGPPFAGLPLLLEPCFGQPYIGLPALLIQRVASQFAQPIAGLQLSTAEIEVLNLLCLGKSNKAIAMSRSRSPETIKRQVAAIYRKLGVENRTSAATIAKQRGLVK